MLQHATYISPVKCCLKKNVPEKKEKKNLGKKKLGKKNLGKKKIAKKKLTLKRGITPKGAQVAPKLVFSVLQVEIS